MKSRTNAPTATDGSNSSPMFSSTLVYTQVNNHRLCISRLVGEYAREPDVRREQVDISAYIG